jgi:predicted molibdopterin-dependent oxidoreductase YjgC
MADIVLPGAAFSEKQGSFTNLEGRIQPFDPVIRPPGNARPDWEILDLLAAQMEQTEGYGDLEKIRMEIRRNVPAYADLNAKHRSWVKETGQMALFNPAGSDGLIKFYPVVTTEAEIEDKDYPYNAIIGSLRYHLGGGSRTAASERIQTFDSIGQIEIAPEDGTTLGITNGDTINVTSQFGMLERAIRLKKEIRPGELFIPIAMHSNDAMNLLDLTDLAHPNTAGWKTVRVKLEKA